MSQNRNETNFKHHHKEIGTLSLRGGTGRVERIKEDLTWVGESIKEDPKTNVHKLLAYAISLCNHI